MSPGKRKKECSGEESGLPLAKHHKLQEAEKQSNLLETDKQSNLLETDKQSNLVEADKQSNLLETDKQSLRHGTEKQTQLQETETQTQLHETETLTQVPETETQTQLQETETQTQLQETETQTQLQETETQTQLQETETRTQLQETETRTQLPETGNGHERKLSYPSSSDSNIPESSRVAVASIPLVGPQAHFPARSLTRTPPHHLDTQDGVCLDEDASKGQHKETQLYIENDVQNKNKKTATKVGGNTFLNVIESGDIDQAIQILKGDNRFNQSELDGALISSCHRGFKHLVQTLVRLGANVQSKDTQGNTPLLICAGNGFIDIVHFLLKKKADVNAFNSAGDTALILSIRAAGSLEMVRVLLEQEGIDISHQNQDGYTALMKAVEVGDVDVMKILMEMYNKEETDGNSEQVINPRSLKPIDAVNLNGQTAEQIADKHGLGNIFHILKTHLINRVSPLLIAIGGNDMKSLNMLLNCHFVVKQDINDALKNIFSSDVMNMTSVTENGILFVKRLLEYGAVGNTSRNVGSTSLSAAVKMGNYDLVDLLCKEPNKQRQLGSPCDWETLITAVRSGNWDIVKLLLKYKTDIDIYKYSNSPLDCALRHHNLEGAKLLIQHGAKMDIRRALQSAVTHQVPEYMKFVFENYRPQVNNFVTKVSSDLKDLLVSAAKGGNLEIIGYLLDAGADVNQENGNSRTPLMESKDGDVAKFLINRGANVNAELDYYSHILQKILKYRDMTNSASIEVMKVLLENGASVNASTHRDTSPLTIAARNNNNVRALQILLDHGADINHKDDSGNTVLIIAACNGCSINVSFLLEFHRVNKLCLNAQNNSGMTALMYASAYCSPEIIEQMINFAADVKVKDTKGNSALLIAAKTRDKLKTKILKTMIKAGSDVNCQNNEGFSPLMMAAQNCRIETILNLLDSGADVNAVSKMDSTKTALSFLPGHLCHRTNFKLCLQAFLNKGASLSYIDPSFLHNLISQYTIDSIPERIQGPIGPVDVRSANVDLRYIDNEDIPTVSPLCVSLLVKNTSLARYFVKNMFLTSSDITFLTGNRVLRAVLGKRQFQDCLTFLDELSTQPWSLLQLAFVSVSTAVGSSPGRENSVNMLPLSQELKDKLLFKSQQQVNAPSQDKDYFEKLQDVNISELTDSDSRVYENYNSSISF